MRLESLLPTVLAVIVILSPAGVQSAGTKAQTMLRENSPAGTLVARKADYWLVDPSRDCHDCVFKIVKSYRGTKTNEIMPATFVIDETTGTVTTVRTLDREAECPKTCNCQINIMVGKARRNSKNFKNMQILTVQLLDVNDNKPLFRSDLRPVNVSESSQVGMPLSIDEYLAIDYDCGPNSWINYTLEANEHFELDDGTGMTTSEYRLMHRTNLALRVKKQLDHEQQSIYRLRLTAADNGRPKSLASHVIILVHVLDDNDNAPVFGTAGYTISVREDVTPGSVVTHVHATDADQGELNGLVRYRLARQRDPFPKQRQSSYPRLIEVDPITGTVTLNSKLSWQKHNGVSFIIEASDQGAKRKNTAQTTLTLNIEDVNNNAPELNIQLLVTTIPTSANTGYISERHQLSTYVAYITTSDKDNGKNAQTTITIEEEGNESGVPYFEYQESDGMMILIRKLDRESRSKHPVTIKACDHGRQPKCTSERYTIVVLDENEFAPEFNRCDYSQVLSEDLPVGSRVLSVHANDRDAQNPPVLWKNAQTGKVEESRNGEVTYSIEDADAGEYFSIDPRSGEVILVKKLDYERRRNWMVNVTASDGATQNKMSSTCLVKITVTDVNDNRPIFLSPPRSNLTAYASLVSDEVVYEIRTIDHDGDASTSIVLMSVDGSTELKRFFLLEPDTGRLRIDKSQEDLDEVNGAHELLFRATDVADAGFWSEITLNVEVWDIALPDSYRYRAPSPDRDRPDDADRRGGYDRAGASSDVMSGSGIFTALIVSLVVVLILIFVLALCIVMKRKRKETTTTHTYSCRDAESKGVYQSGEADEPRTNNNNARQHVKTTSRREEDEGAESLLGGSSRQEGVASIDVSMKPRPSCRYVKEEKSFNIPARRLTPSSNVDVDSGRGDSDPDGNGNYGDNMFGNGFSVYNPTTASLPRSERHLFRGSSTTMTTSAGGGGGSVVSALSTSSPPAGTSHAPMSSNCTKECHVFGHSDRCWMPHDAANEAHHHHHHHQEHGNFYPDFSGAGGAPQQQQHLETIQEAGGSGAGGYGEPCSVMKSVPHHPLVSLDPTTRRNYYFAPVASTSSSSAYHPLAASHQARADNDSDTPSPPPSSGNTSRHSITSSSCGSSSRHRRSPAERYLSLAKTGDYTARTTPLLAAAAGSSAGAGDDEAAAQLNSISMRETQKIVKDIDQLLAQHV